VVAFAKTNVKTEGSIMSPEEMQSVGDAYQAKFGNMDELSIAEILWNPRFIQLLQKAIDQNSPVTDQELVSVFPEVAEAY